jgi:hypothetical protein
MKDHRSTEELLEIVGPARQANLPERVAAAESELRSRTASEEALFGAKARKIGTLCAWLGGLFLAWGIAFVPIGLSFFSEMQPKTGQEPFLFRNFNIFFVGVAILEAIAGALLLVGGLKFRRGSDLGRKLILLVLWMTMAYVVLFTVSWVLSVPSQLGPGGFPLVMVFFGILMAVAWCALLLLPVRYFRSSRVRQLCRSAA